MSHFTIQELISNIIIITAKVHLGLKNVGIL